MTIILNLDVMLAKSKMRSKALAQEIGLSEQSLSILKTGKALGIRFSTLDKICAALDCMPSDIIQYVTSEKSSKA